MSLPDRVRVLWRDFQGRTARNLIHLPTGATTETIETLVGLLAALTACEPAIVRAERVVGEPSELQGDTGDYATRRDIAVIKLRSTASGARVVPVVLPGPLASIFLADTQSIDPGNADVLALLDWLQANACDATGANLGPLYTGYRDYIDEYR